MKTKFRCTGCGDEDMPCELTITSNIGFFPEEIRCVLKDQDDFVDEAFLNETNWEEVKDERN